MDKREQKIRDSFVIVPVETASDKTIVYLIKQIDKERAEKKRLEELTMHQVDHTCDNAKQVMELQEIIDRAFALVANGKILSFWNEEYQGHQHHMYEGREIKRILNILKGEKE